MGITPSTRHLRPGTVGSADSHLSDDDANEPEGFDPADHNIDEVKAYVEANPDEAEAVFSAEIDGKNRSTLTAWLTDFAD